MELFCDISHLNTVVQFFFRNGTATNNYFLVDSYAKHIQEKKLSYISSDENIIFLLEKPHFYQLYYYLNDFDKNFELPKEKPVVMEIVYRGQQNMPKDILGYWEKNGFKLHLTRDNMIAAFDKLILPKKTVNDLEIKYVDTENEVLYTEKLFKQSFDKYTGDMLSLPAIKNFAGNRNIICAIYKGLPAGILQFEIKNNVVWLGHIAVDEKFRGKGIASELVKGYILDNNRGNKTKYQLWVIQDNIGAVNLYRNFGFVYGNKTTTSLLRLGK